MQSRQPRDDTKRRYSSAVRDERANQTRRRIAAAAHSLFTEHGFTGTTVASIAERAGVAVPTVYATFGSKSAIVASLLEQMEHNADNALWVRRISEAPNSRARLAAFAQWSTALFSSSKAIIQATNGAAADPAINELRKEGDRHRRNGLRAVIDLLAEDGSLASGLSKEHALDRAWMLTGIELYLSATDGCNWADADYEQWLTTLLQQQLLNP